ncbi:MAG: DUF4831 family protein [Bacteroidales bacterium]|nr:DUF4831 family protein [Bacteroidales bacterium]
MKKTLTILALCLAGTAFSGMRASAQDPAGTVSYALPQTTIVFEVEAVREYFYAGPYAKYAQKYLGVTAREEDAVTCHLNSVRMTPTIEADQQARYYVDIVKGSTSFLSLCSQGLVAVSDGSFGDGSVWRFASQSGADFSDKGVSSNLTSEATTLYRGVQDDASFNRVAVQQNMVVQKSLEQRAQEAASTIFDLRKKRIQIVTGDTDATYSGEAMGAALEEIAALEKEYMSMFIGYSEYQTQTLKCDVVPEKDRKNQKYIAFRLSDTDGIVAADNVSGSPYILELEPQQFGETQGRASAAKGAVAVYRVPSICKVKLTDGVNPILQDRIAVYQLGTECYFPVGK